MTDETIPVLLPPQEITTGTLAEFDRRVEPMLAGASEGLVVDLDDVRMISSAGLGHLVRLGQALDQRGGLLALARGRRSVSKLLRTVGLDAVMPLFRTVEDAASYVRTREMPEDR